MTTPEEAIAAVKAARVTVYVVGIGGVAGISMRGRAAAEALAARNGRPGRSFRRGEETSRRCTTRWRPTRRTATWSPTRRRNQSGDGTWRSDEDLRGARVQGARAGRLLRAEAAAHPPVARVHRRWTAEPVPRDRAPTTSSSLEDGVEQKIDTFQEAVTPVSIVLALDASGSMKKSAARWSRPRARSSRRCGRRTASRVMRLRRPGPSSRTT